MWGGLLPSLFEQESLMNKESRRKRVAILAAGSLDNRKGVMNVVHNRIKHIKQVADFKVDVYLISVYYPVWLRIISHKKQQERPSVVSLDGVDYNILWRPFSLFDYLLRIKLKKKPVKWKSFVKKTIRRLRDYDLIDCHSFQSGDIACAIKELFGVPYVVTWHGTDIHTEPFQGQSVFVRTREIIENADCNFFVSQDLLRVSADITPKGEKTVLYNAMDKRFVQYDKDRRDQLRKSFHVEGKKVVTFCGNLIPVKNVDIIPKIFKIIYECVPEVFFWVIGDGSCKKAMRMGTEDLPIAFWGNQPPESIPDYFNVTDVLILPSKNEGLPLVTVEALSCGCKVVGSRVGGIPEVIGVENTVPLNQNNFEENFAQKVISFLLDNEMGNPSLPDYFDWNIAAQKENSIICSIINR